MKLLQSCLALLLGPVLLSHASALEPTASVKAKTVLKATTTWAGQPIEYPKGQAAVTGLVVEIAVGAETGWHQHPVASFALVLEGELEVRLKNGESRRFAAGQAFAEVVDTLHNGRNVGTVPVKLAVFYAGATDSTLTIKEAAMK